MEVKDSEFLRYLLQSMSTNSEKEKKSIEDLYGLKGTQLNELSLNSQSLKFRDMRTVFSIAHFFSC